MLRILLAVDGSEESYEAVRALAHLSPPEAVSVVYALDVPRPAYPMMSPEVATDLYTTVEKSMRDEGERVLARAASLLPLHSGAVTKRLETGKPTDIILSVAADTQANMIALGARGVGPMKELLLGSVSHRVLSHAHCPVLVVKNPVRPLRRILLPVQGPEDAEAAISFLKTHPFAEATDITVLTAVTFAEPAWPAGVAVTESMKEHILEGARFFVEDVASRLSSDKYRATGVAVIGTPSSAILKHNSKHSPDLIVMGSRGRTGVTRFVLGSVSHAVLHQTTCPLIMFPWPGV